MDIISSLLGNKLGKLTSVLTENSGFSQQQAEKFVPEATKEVLNTFKNQGQKLDLSDPAGTASILLSSLNIEDLASKVGISTELVQTGMTALMPTLLFLAEEHGDKLSGLSSMLNKLEGSPLGGLLGGISGKFFGK